MLRAQGRIELSMLAVSADISLYRDASHVLALLQLCADYGPAGISAEEVDEIFFGRLRRQTAEGILAQGVNDGSLAVDDHGRHRLQKYGQDSLAEGKAWVLEDSGLWTLLVVGGGNRSLLCGQEGYVIRQIDGREELPNWHPLEHIPQHPEWDALRRLIAALGLGVCLWWGVSPSLRVAPLPPFPPSLSSVRVQAQTCTSIRVTHARQFAHR
jgi:hypothetical protein